MNNEKYTYAKIFRSKSKKKCKSISSLATDNWCNTNCNYDTPYCPKNLCVCEGDPLPDIKNCKAIKGTTATDEWCNNNWRYF